MTMAVAVIFDVLMLLYFGSKVEIVDVIVDLIRNKDSDDSDRDRHRRDDTRWMHMSSLQETPYTVT